jgi:WGR domain
VSGKQRGFADLKRQASPSESSIMALPRISVQGTGARPRIHAMTAPALYLRRIDATRNMRRFYRLDIEPDLFGGFLLVRQWERVGALRVTVQGKTSRPQIYRR